MKKQKSNRDPDNGNPIESIDSDGIPPLVNPLRLLSSAVAERWLDMTESRTECRQISSYEDPARAGNKLTRRLPTAPTNLLSRSLMHSERDVVPIPSLSLCA